VADYELLRTTIRAWEQGRVIALRNLLQEKTPADRDSLKNQAGIIARTWLDRSRRRFDRAARAAGPGELRDKVEQLLGEMNELHDLAESAQADLDDILNRVSTDPLGLYRLLRDRTRNLVDRLWELAHWLDIRI
jgi:hypothetical protein